jgi:hypothetical protein
MSPEQIQLRQAIAEERARLLEQLLHDLAALRQLMSESQQHMNDARAQNAAPLRSREVGMPVAPLPPAEQDTIE